MKIVIAVLLITCGVPVMAADTIQGRWKLLTAEDVRADGTVARYPWGRKPVGAIVVEGGYSYVQIMSGDVPSFTPGKPIGEQMTAALLSTYISYSGACAINDDCASGNCTNGTCEENSWGSSCDYDDDCSSGVCTNGECQQ